MKSFKTYISEGPEAELIGLLKSFGAGEIELNPDYLSTRLRKKEQVWEIVSRLPAWTDYDVFVYELNPATAERELENPGGIDNSENPYTYEGGDGKTYTIDEIGYEDLTDQFHEYQLVVYLYNAEQSEAETEGQDGVEARTEEVVFMDEVLEEATAPTVKKDPKEIGKALLAQFGRDPIYQALITAIMSGKRAEAQRAKSTLVSIRGPQALKNVQDAYRKLMSEGKEREDDTPAEDAKEKEVKMERKGKTVMVDPDAIEDYKERGWKLVKEEKEDKKKEKKKKDDIEAAESDQGDGDPSTAGTDAEYESFEGEDGEQLDERRRVVKVNARGKRRIKIMCKKGYKYANGKCVKITGTEAVNKRKAIRKAVRTKKSKGSGFQRRVQRLRSRALKKRKSMGLNSGFDITAKMPKTHSPVNADTQLNGTQIVESFMDKRTEWTDKYKELLSVNEDYNEKLIDWNIATHYFYEGKTPEEAIDTIENHYMESQS